jgi:multicomponent Na+:H+ antiporter subunit D
MIALFTVIPLAVAFVIWIIGARIRRLPSLIATLACLCAVSVGIFCMINLWGTGFRPMVYFVGGWKPPIGISMVLDGLSLLMLLIVNIVALAAVIFSISYMTQYTDESKYYTLFMLMLAGMNGVIVTGDLFNMFVFMEIATIASTALVAFGTEHEELEASFRYIVLATVASLLILLGIGILYAHTSTLNLADMSVELAGKKSTGIAGFVMIMFLMGFGLKSAVVPFHAWLPDAHPSAPAPISAMLSGVLIKSLGVYALVRIAFNIVGVKILN